MKSVCKRSGLTGWAKRGLVAAAMLWGASASASVVQLNPQGDGAAGASISLTNTGVHGSGFVMMGMDASSPTGFVFSETGAYELAQPAGASAAARDVTLTYSVTGTLNPLTGALTISGGMFNLYSDANFNFGTTSSDPNVIFGANDGTLISSFLITSGGGIAGGLVYASGQAIAGSVLPGYFFSAAGVDLAVSSGIALNLVVGNAINTNPSPTDIYELVCKTTGFAGPGCGGTGFGGSPYYFLVQDGGSATLSTSAPTSVPEPGSRALAFTGLAAMCLVSRRKRNAMRVL